MSQSTETGPQSPSKPETYLVTADIVPTLRNRMGFNVSHEQAEQLYELEQEYVEKLEGYIPDSVHYDVVEAETVKDWLEAEMSTAENPVVSIDDVHPPEEYVDAYLDATRVTDTETGESVKGTRSAEESYEENVDRIADEFDRVDLVDIGAFTGGTIQETIEEFEARGVEVGEVYLPINGSDLNVESMEEYDFHDWLELRDLFGIDGRKTGEGPNTFIPYWENLSGWASIPEEVEEEVEEVSREYHRQVAEILDIEENELGEHVPLN